MATRPDGFLRCAVGATLALSGVTPAAAQTDGASRAWVVVPRIGSTVTMTDNASLGGAGKQSEIFTEISPGVRVQMNSARLKGSIDYALRAYVAAQDSNRNRTQNALNGNVSLEAWENWLYLDASALISQQTISAFGPSSVGAANVNANSTETSTFRFSPYMKGRVFSAADYLVRYTHAETKTQSGSIAGVSTDDFNVQLRGVVTGPLGWVVDGISQSNAYSGGTTYRSNRINGRVTYRFNPEMTGFVSAGVDRNNYGATQAQQSTMSGWGLEWIPTPRTNISVSRERRSFGDSHAINLTHRTALAAIRFSDTRNVAILPNTAVTATQGTYADLFSAQLAGLYPDPVQRAQAVSTLLAQAGISPTATITNGFLASQLSVQRRQELSLVVNGLRNTVTYTLFQSDSSSLSSAVASVADDLVTARGVKSRGMSSNFSHRLTPMTSVNMLSSWMRNAGTGANLSTTQRTFSLNVSSRLSARTSGSIGLRNVVSEGTTSYRENAVLGTIATTF